MNDSIENLLDDIKASYAELKNWSNGDPEIRSNMITTFNEGLKFKVGKKYIKIMSGGSVWGFVVNTENDSKFKIGDILKPASWASPTRNSARGNIVNGDYSVSWTGPHYLK
jgi:hypothetical protein